MNKSTYIISLLLWAPFLGAMQQPTPLSKFGYTGAWVLPTTHFMKNGKRVKYVVLGRETGGRDKGKYDAFGGKRDRGEKHPVVTAAREFYEEAITSSTLGVNEKAIRTYIDLKAGNTGCIMGINDTRPKQKHVLYMTNFKGKDIAKLERSFAAARNRQQRWKYKEKDCIACVRWDRLVIAIKSSTSNTGVKVQATVTDLRGKKSHKTIELRGVLVKILRSYIEGKPSTKGKNPKIKYWAV